MSKVYVVQRPTYFDKEKRGWVNKYDLSSAEAFGELVVLLRPGNIFRGRLNDTVRKLEIELAPFTKDDYILAIGDPVAIAITVMIASQRTGGRVSLLKYDRREDAYAPYSIRLNVG